MAARKGNSKEREARIASYLEAAGAYRVSLPVKQELAKEFGVSVRQIRMDINKILTKMTKPKIKKIQGQFLLTLNSNMHVAHELLRNPDPLIKARGIDAANKTIQIYTDFLEKFGFKTPITQKDEFGDSEIDREAFEANKKLAEEYINLSGREYDNYQKMEKILIEKLGEKLSKKILKEFDDKIYPEGKQAGTVPMKDKNGEIVNSIKIRVPSDGQIRAKRVAKYGAQKQEK